MQRPRTLVLALVMGLVLVGLTGLLATAPAGATTAVTSGSFQPLPAARVLDTGAGTGAAKASVKAHATLTFQVTGRGGVPATGASAVAMNVTVAAPTESGYVTVFPAGQARPTASNINFTSGRSVPNLVVVQMVSSGKVSIYNGSTGTVRLVADVSGYYLSGALAQSGGFVPLSPTRILDTGAGTGAPQAALASHATLTLQVTRHGGVPNGASSVVLNLTVAAETGNGYVTAYPSDQTQPATSNVNFIAGRTAANLVVLQLSSDGRLSIYNGSSGSVRLVGDVSGYFDAGTAGTNGNMALATPQRILDTGNGTGAPQVPIGPQQELVITVPTIAGVSASEQAGLIVNVTVASPTAGGYLSVTPHGSQSTSNLNFQTGHTAANLVMVQMRGNGQLHFYNASAGTVRVVADVFGVIRHRQSLKTWQAPTPIAVDSVSLGLSCPTTTFCQATTTSGDALTYNGSSWTSPVSIAPGKAVVSVSCPTTTFCAAVGQDVALTWDGSHWSAPVTLDDQLGLDDVSCASPTMCVAVADDEDGASIVGSAYVFNGTSWTASPVTSSGLLAVSCPTSSFCLAGDFTGAALTFDGAHWTKTAGAPFGVGDLVSLSCTSATFCAAARDDGVRTWNGTTWSALHSFASDAELGTMSCTTSSHCVVATGDIGVSTYDGSAWSGVTTVMPPGTSFAASVSCATTTDCVLISGDGYFSSLTGGSWSTAAAFDPSPGSPIAVSCPSTSFCTAVTTSGYAVQYNGTNWTAPQQVTQRVELDHVSCATATFCVATTSDGRATTWRGATWSALESAAPGDEVDVPISCPTTTYCAVSNGTDTATYNGTAWTLRSGGDPVGMDSIDCVSAVFCIGTGAGAATSNGTTWTEHDAGAPAVLGPVSCMTTTSCYAVSDGTASFWTGSTWFAVPGADPGGSMIAVSCTAAGMFCAAVEQEGSAVTRDGSWSDPTPLVDAPFGTFMDVSCASPLFCAAVDAYTGSAIIGTQ